MEHRHLHDSMTQTQHQTPLPESAVAHHDKTEESPTCTDTTSYLETVPCTTTTTTTAIVVDSYQTEDNDVAASLHEQKQELHQQLGAEWTSTPAHQEEQDSTEISLICDGLPGSAADKELVDEDSNLESGGDTGSDDSPRDTDLRDSALTNAALLGNTNQESIQQPSSTSLSHTNNNTEACETILADSNNSMNTKDTPCVVSNGTDSDYGKRQKDDNTGQLDVIDGPHRQQSADQTNVNVTSDDDKDNSEGQITNQSVDIVDGTFYGTSVDTPSSTSDPINYIETESMLSPNQEQEQNTSEQNIILATDNTTQSVDSIPPTDHHFESIVQRDDEEQHHNQRNQTDDNGQSQGDNYDDDDDDDNIPLMSQYEADRNNILPSASTTTATTSLSISTGRTPVAHGAVSDQPLTRVTTTGSDEQTLSEPPRPRHVWESDRQASECRRCNRRFSFLVRRHHCRRCGQIVCDRCSSHRVRLPVEELVEDPLISTSHYPIIALTPQRVCESCVRIPIKATDSNSGVTSRYSTLINNNHMGEDSTTGHGHRPHPMNMQRTDSQQSLMTECPVCGTGLLGMRKGQQENHLNQCLNTGSPTVRPPRYIIYTLTEGTAQVGDECPICFEEFEVGNKIARMVCLCSYHRHCLRDWLERGKGCPIHYDSDIGTY